MCFFWCCVGEIFVWTDMVITSVELAVHVYASFGDPFSRSQNWNNTEVNLPMFECELTSLLFKQVPGDVQPTDRQPRGPTGNHHMGRAHGSEEERFPLWESNNMAYLQVSGDERERKCFTHIITYLSVSNVASWETESQTTWPVLKKMATRGRGSTLPLSWTLFASNMWDWVSNKMAYLEVCVVRKGMLLPYKLFVSDMRGW